MLTPFLRQGLERGEKVLYIVDTRTAESILGYLLDEGVDVEAYMDSGQLAIFTSGDAYMREGAFDPERMIAFLRAQTDQALAEGYPALRVTGEMSWALRGFPGSERLIDYEARLNEFFQTSKCLAICQYDRRCFDAPVLLDVLCTHPIAVIGTKVYDNFYYIPPAEFLSEDRPAAELRRWMQNLAERNQLEQTLRESEARLRGLFETMAEGIVLIAPDGQIVQANPAAERILGLQRTEIEARNYVAPDWEVVRLDGTPMPPEEMAGPRAMKEKRLVKDVVMGAKRPDGSIRWINVSSAPLMDETGRFMGVVSTFADITERVRAEKALQESEAKLKSIFRAAPVGIGVVVNQVFVEVNDRFCEMTGYSREELLGQNARKVYPTDEDHEYVSLEKCRQIQEGGTGTLETRFKRKDGKIIHVLLSSTSLDPANLSAGVVFTALDITERV